MTYIINNPFTGTSKMASGNVKYHLMINYRSYTVEELATDDMFRRWVMDSTPEISFFWQRWTAENPDRRPIVNQAKELVLAVHEIYKDDLNGEVLSREIEEIVRLAELKKQQSEGKILRLPMIWRAAAVLLLVSGLGIFYYLGQSSKTTALVPHLVAEKNDSMLVRSNSTQQEMTVLLSDNSVATLVKGSTITFPKQFNRSERRVYLTGEAFFDVTKNPEQPFLVYTNETVTKVLGTSFRVKAFDQENTVMVVVKTGRVSVYPKKEYETIATSTVKKISGVVLNPNQQVVFIRNENRLKRGNVANPQMLSESIVQKELIFDDKPVTQVLQTLEKVYGIEISYDTEILADCVISAQFNDETLKQRMNAICQAIGASYEVVNGQIVIISKGCSQAL
ncbi:FecR family protein [Dyadobacter pollutisoli]|uniref:FecR family protein n=1 Tax=Dyadobacter pollutisoli TaxID=2910158 RepID=A0A9E8SM31_9BACT|nr:FecR family protein [Dyadobacter pollutisoli]WAC14295.1 FecR family protein [Dyadobacter pollutisoli]